MINYIITKFSKYNTIMFLTKYKPYKIFLSSTSRILHADN